MSELDPKSEPEKDADPEGLVEVQGQKLVPLAALTAEREKARRTTEDRVTKELVEPLKEKLAKTTQLEQDLQAIQPQLEYLKAHPELMHATEAPDLQAVTDEAAERFARQYELYTATGLDLSRAKRMIADQRSEIQSVAKQAAEEAVQPYAHSSAEQSARANFVWAAQEAQRRGVDPKALAETWTRVPAELSQHREVAEHLLRVAIGDAAYSGTLTLPPTHAPTFTEAPGGRAEPYRISDLERHVAKNAGIGEKAWTERAKDYQPDAVNVLGE